MTDTYQTFTSVRVTFEMDVPSGPWGDTAEIGEIRRLALGNAQRAAQRVVEAAAEHARVRLRVTGFKDLAVSLSGEIKP